MTHADQRRRAGLLVPLFSFPSTMSWGIGEIGDVRSMAAWLSRAGQRVLQLLPLNEMASGQQSPYSALTAMAIDPIFISMSTVPDFAASGGLESLSAEDRAALEHVRSASAVDYAIVRRIKQTALEAAFAVFHQTEWCRDTTRAQLLREYITKQAWWCDDYALFRALHARESNRPWLEWPEPLQRRASSAIDDARRELADRILFYQYLQWIAHAQWSQARADARAHGVALFGDLPFMVDGDSADVWSRQQDFRLDVSTGVPPDAFSATGQDWGMPVYNWETIAADDFRWLRNRARRSADLFDGYRVDHLVGFYRTYARPRDGAEPFFTPADETAQRALGEHILEMLREPGTEIIAEDLGTVPDFVRQSLSALGVPGFKVLRWERAWHVKGQPFHDPQDYPAISVATSGTHDTETLAVWWDHASAEERRQVSALPTIRRLAGGALADVYNPAVRDLLVQALFASRSDLLILPVQDVFGWTARINEPATVNGDNWTFRLPWLVDRLADQPDACDRQEQLRAWAEQYGRLGRPRHRLAN